MRIRWVVAAALIAGFSACGAKTASQATSATSSPAIAGIRSFVAGEDTGFSGIQGAPTGVASDAFTYYDSSLRLPGAAACAVYTVKKNGNRFGTCDFDAATQTDANALWDTWTKDIADAEPGWKLLSVRNGHHVAEMIVADPEGVHGVYIYILKKQDGTFRLTTTFGTMKAILN